MIGDPVGMQVDTPEFLHYQIKQVVLVEFVDPVAEGKLVEDLPSVGGKAADVLFQIVAGAGRSQGGEGKLRRIVERGSGDTGQDQVLVEIIIP